MLDYKDSTHRKLSDSARNICKSIAPAISKVANVLNESGKNVAPISSVKVICDGNEQKKMKDIVDPTNKQKCRDIQIHLSLLW